MTWHRKQERRLIPLLQVLKMAEPLFILYGKQAINVAIVINAGQALHWEQDSVEGRTRLRCYKEVIDGGDLTGT